MKNWVIWISAVTAIAVWTGMPGNADATCYQCAQDYSCIDACSGSGGKNQCSFQRHCGTFGCVNFNCEVLGNSCLGTAECAACAEALEECGVENAGASLIVPNGEAPPCGFWLGLKERELKVCRNIFEPDQRPGSLPAAVTSSLSQAILPSTIISF